MIGLTDQSASSTSCCAAVTERRAHAEARLRLDGAREAILLLLQVAHRNVQHGHFHAARDVHADGVGDHRVVRGQHAADGQAVADVRIRHQRARDRHRQQTRFLHLHHRVVFETFAPLAIFHGNFARRNFSLSASTGERVGVRCRNQRLGELAAQRVVHERRRIGDDGRDLLVQSRLVAAAEDEFGNKIRRAAGRLSQWHAETEKIFGVHQNLSRCFAFEFRLNI